MGHFAEWKPTWNDFLFGTAENGHQSCGPEQRGFIIVCGPRSVTLGVMRNQMEWQRKLLQPGMNAHGYTTVGNVLKPQVVVFFSVQFVNNCIDLWRWPYHMSARSTSQPVCTLMSFLIKKENPLERGGGGAGGVLR